MTLVVIYLTVTLYKKAIRPAFSGKYSHTVIIDAGHGEPDGGATGIKGTSESEINLKISKKLSAMLEEKCYNVIMTRETETGIYSEGDSIREKKLSDMHNREKILNGSKADAFISIHMNSFSDSSVSGAQVFYSENNEKSLDLAMAIRERIVPLYEKNDRILKEAPDSVYLMKKANIPACLVECGFLSNAENEALLTGDEYQEKMAEAIACGIDDYFKGDTNEK